MIIVEHIWLWPKISSILNKIIWDGWEYLKPFNDMQINLVSLHDNSRIHVIVSKDMINTK